MYEPWPTMEEIGSLAKIDHNQMRIEASRYDRTALSCMAVPTFMGDFSVGASAFGVCALFFPEADDYDVATLCDYYGIALSSWGKKCALEAGLELMGYALGEVKSFGSPIDLSYLTDFQRDVLFALKEVPYGRTVSMKELAALAGHPRKIAPVAGVVKHNPLPIFIPCHRVMPGDGTVGDWSGGHEWKRFLLAYEGVEVNEITA